MKRLLLLPVVIVSALVLAGCDLPGSKPKDGALQINSVPTATVFIDGKHVGKTPYYDEKVGPGDYIVKVLTEIEGTRSAVWSGKVKVTSNTLTLVNRELSDKEGESAGEVLTLEKISNSQEAELAIVTNVDGVTVKLNQEFKGTTPVVLTGLSEGSKEMELSLSGYETRRIKFQLAKGYRLTIESDLAKTPGGKKDSNSTVVNNDTPKITGTEETNKVTPESTESAKVGFSKGDKVIIGDTGTGWLRVRIEPSINASEAAKVDTGKEFTVIDVNGEWVKIEYESGNQGWVNSSYLTKK